MSLGARAKRTAVRLGILVVVLALGAATFELLSQLNERTFTLHQENDQLVIHKGKGLPFGSDPYRPSDPLLADTYAPIPLERLEVGSFLERRFTDRDELEDRKSVV